MLVSDYIQWNLEQNEMDEISEPFLQYAKTKKNIMNRSRYNRYSEIIKSKFKNDDNMRQYFDLINSILGNKSFQGAVNTAVNQISFPSYSNMQLKYIEGIKQELKNNASNYQRLVSEVQSALQGIITALGTMDLDSVIDPAAIKAIDQIFGDKSNTTKLVKNSEYQKLDKMAIGQYKYLLSLLPDFQDVLNSTQGSDASILILSRLLVPIQTLIGFSSEFQIKYEVDKIVDDLEKDLRATGLKVERVGGDEGSTDGGFKIGTADLSVIIGEASSINFNIPNLGMSLKRSSKNLNTAKDVNIKLKGSTYGKLLHDVDPGVVTAFYTLYAYTNPKNLGDVPNSTLTGAYKLMKMEASITSLIGNINTDNLVFVLVVNNKAITIFDLLESMADSPNDPFTLTPAFKSSRPGLINVHKKYYAVKKNGSVEELAQERSRKLRSYITNKMSASVTVKLTQAQLERFR